MGDYSVALVEDDKNLADMLPHFYRLHGNGHLDPRDFDTFRETRDELSDDPVDALEYLDSNYDVVVLDNGVPWDWEGAQLLYEAADRELSTEIILYTNAIDYDKNRFDYDRVKFIDEHRDKLHYIRKNREELVESVDEALSEESS